MPRGKDRRKFKKSALKLNSKNTRATPRGGYRL